MDKVDTKTFTNERQWQEWLRTRYFGDYRGTDIMTHREKNHYILDLEERLVEIYKLIDKME